MNDKEEGILLGKLEAFREDAMERLSKIEQKVDSLDKFKVKVTIIMVSLLGVIEVGFRLLEAIK